MEYERDYEDHNDKDRLLNQFSTRRKQHHISSFPTLNRIRLVLSLLIITIIFSFSFSIGTYFYEESIPQSSLSPTSSIKDEEINSISTAAHDWIIPTPPIMLPETLPITINTGTIPFSSSLFPALLPLRPPQLTSTVVPFSAECLESWLVRGSVCPSLFKRWKDDPMDIDVVWTWGNISGELMREYKNELMGVRGATAAQKLASMSSGKLTRRYVAIEGNKMLPAKESQFRDHDELRFSMRSILSAFPTGNLNVLHLITGDSPSLPPSFAVSDPSNFISDQISKSFPRVAQIPHYLNLSLVEFSGLNKLPLTYQEVLVANGTGGFISKQERLPRLRIHSHSELFKTAAYGTELVEEGEERDEMKIWENDEKVAKEWRDNVLPCFNSLAIESQLPNLEDMADTFLYLNDDFFVLNKLSQSDVASPLTGPVLRMQRDLMVTAIDPYTEDITNPQGEWKGLGYANYLLDNRFGARQRPYVLHQAKSVSTPLLREAQEAFLDEFTTTAASRFRGQSIEIQTSFLRIHYIIEKHRESLLWAFFYARSDLNQDGIYSNSERTKIFNILGWDFHTPSIPVYAPSRSTLPSLNNAHLQAGLPLPLESRIDFTSMDGYSHFLADSEFRFKGATWPSWTMNSDNNPVCSINIRECFGPDFHDQEGEDEMREIDIGGVFKRISFGLPRCGDCIIVELIRQSGRKGFEAFLPKLISSDLEDLSPPQVELVGLSTTSTYHEANFTLPHLPPSTNKSHPPPSLRRRTLALIHRYSYTIATSKSEFIPVQSSASLEHRLHLVDYQSKPTFMALNDETGTFLAQRFLDLVDDVMGRWLKKTFSIPSRWEIQE